MLATFMPGLTHYGSSLPKWYPIIVASDPKMSRLFDDDDQPSPRGSCFSSRRRHTRTTSVMSMIFLIPDQLIRTLSAVVLSQPHTNHGSPSPLLTSPRANKWRTAVSLPFSRTKRYLSTTVEMMDHERRYQVRDKSSVIRTQRQGVDMQQSSYLWPRCTTYYV